MDGGADEDTITGANSVDWICGGPGVFDSLSGGDGADVIVDCISNQESLDEDENPNNCHVTHNGNDGSDILCWLYVGGVDGDICLDGDLPNDDDLYSCDGEKIARQLNAKVEWLQKRNVIRTEILYAIANTCSIIPFCTMECCILPLYLDRFTWRRI